MIIARLQKLRSKLGRPSYSYMAFGILGMMFLMVLFSRSADDVAAVPAAAKAIPAEPGAPVILTTKIPDFSDFLNGEFEPLKSKAARITTVAVEAPPRPPPLATVAAAEANAPKHPDPCEVAVRRLARTTAVPVKESFLDDLEAKYELIRASSNQRFLAIRSACIPKGHPKRG